MSLNKLDTVASVIAELQERVADHSESQLASESNGYEMWDYYDGLIEGYSCVLAMLNDLDKE
jgi:hypothetical protein